MHPIAVPGATIETAPIDHYSVHGAYGLALLGLVTVAALWPAGTSVLRRRHHDNAPPAHGLTRRSAGRIASGEDDNHFAG